MAWESSSKRQEFWDAQVRRADHLASKNEATRELLTFYAQLKGTIRVRKKLKFTFDIVARPV